jgi:hypothetical protein
MAEQEKITTSPFGRFLKMGALAGRVGFSLVGEKALGLFLSEDSREMRMAKAWAKNAEKIAETLGNLTALGAEANWADELLAALHP